MYRTFLSWRYLRARRANWIGIVGICVGVGAMILILSIMAGFLDENRKMVRGSLSDLVIQPILGFARTDGRAVPTDPDKVLALVRADKRVAGACAQLAYFAILSQEGQDAKLSERRLSDPQYNDRSSSASTSPTNSRRPSCGRLSSASRSSAAPASPIPITPSLGLRDTSPPADRSRA